MLALLVLYKIDMKIHTMRPLYFPMLKVESVTLSTTQPVFQRKTGNFSVIQNWYEIYTIRPLYFPMLKVVSSRSTIGALQTRNRYQRKNKGGNEVYQTSTNHEPTRWTITHAKKHKKIQVDKIEMLTLWRTGLYWRKYQTGSQGNGIGFGFA